MTLPEMGGRWTLEGKGLAPKKDEILDIQFNIIYTELAYHNMLWVIVMYSLEIPSCNLRTASHCGQVLHDYATETITNPYTSVS
jgi:hypothetical protein